ncbi:hypothetical protein RJT34_08477 [Clitoria ternatea]|uniref:Uncharacterized protein n=1 Tax=Clitoria ternatea TaxID=43366 RepID=A0AAN9K7S0_CLITE
MLVRIIFSPIRALGKARDMYVRSITSCGQNMSYGDPMDAAGRFSALSRSASAATSRSEDKEDFVELMRAASARTLVNRIDVDLVLKQQQHSSKGLPKSSSVGMGRIDEEKPYDTEDPYPRSRSYAVGNRNVAF